MNTLKNKFTVIKKLRTNPLKILGYVLAGLILITGLSANAATISGIITDSTTSSTIENVLVKVISHSGDFMSVIETDAVGFYRIQNLNGNYNIVFSHPLYSESPPHSFGIFGTSSYPYSPSIDPLPPVLPITGSVINVNEPGGLMKTYLEVVIENDFLGTLPDDIDTITVLNPSSVIVAQYSTAVPGGWEYYPQLRDFFIKIDGSPDTGTYSFGVTSGALSVDDTDNQDANYTIPIPDTLTFLPLDGAVLSSKNPTFSWGPVTSPGGSGITIHYRLVIYENNSGSVGQRVYASNRGAGMLSFTVPNGVLNPGQTYFWRVRAEDSSDWELVQNRSHSDFLSFTLEKDPKRLQWFDVTVYDGSLSADFGLLPGFRDKLVSAVLSIPNSGRTEYPSYAYDLVADRFIDWDTECRYLDIQVKNFGPIEDPYDYGDYTLTLNFSDGAQEVYTTSLARIVLFPVVAPITTSVNDDGSIFVEWSPPGGGSHYYQVRVRDSSNKEYCRVGSFFNASEATLSAWDLRCLKKGETYRLLVRIYDLNFNATLTEEVPIVYNPTFLTHTDYYTVDPFSWKGLLAFHFDTRPGSREQVHSSIVTWPPIFEYEFDLVNNWYSISTETRSNNGWWHEESGLATGEYTFTITFDEDQDNTPDHTEIFIKSLDIVPVAPVESLSMLADITDFGTIDFYWDAPDGQAYQVRIRTPDGSREYYSSPTLSNYSGGLSSLTVTASFWDLRGLEHGQEYQWFVRAFDPDFNVMEESERVSFVYNPFDNEGDGLFDLWDPDDDNDGRSDWAEVNIYHTNPLNFELDSDKDGLIDIAELEMGIDPYNPDSDGDGLFDGEEVCVLGTYPYNDDSDDDTYLDGDDAFPLDPTEWADSDGDGIGDNSDNCPLFYNEDQGKDLDDDGIGDACDQDADGDGWISPYFGGDDCDDLDPNIFPGDGTCEGISAKPKPPTPNEDPPNSDDDTFVDTEDNCPVNTNQLQVDTDDDGVGDACDNCNGFPNPDQKLPVFYRDQDGDGYSTGETIEECHLIAPDGYRSAEGLFGLNNDCNDNNESINPGMTEIEGNGIDDDCNPETPDVVSTYNITFEMEGAAYDTWLPEDGMPVIITFNVTGPGSLETLEFSFSQVDVTNYPGKYTNDAGANSDNDFTVSDFSGNRLTLNPLDYGGKIIIHVTAAFTANGTPVVLEKDISFPKDTDKDGIADKWELDNGLDWLTHDSGLDPDSDGLTHFEEYRGVKWGELTEYSETQRPEYATPAFIPEGGVTHIRTNPNRRTLFIQYQGFDETHPFAIGKAYDLAEIDVYALDTSVVAAESLSDDYNIDVVTIRLIDGTYSEETGHISKRGTRDYTFDTLGVSSYGTIDSYGLGCKVYKTTIDYYFSDKPYKDWTTFNGTNMRDQNSWIAKNGKLDLLSAVEDKDDDGLKDGGEDKSGNGVLDGDYIVREGAEPGELWNFNHDLSPFNINNNFDIDSVPLVELPVGDITKEYTRAQVLKHVVTHEIGHNIGINLHTEAPLCVMYKYSTDWIRDDFFSQEAKDLIMIINY